MDMKEAAISFISDLFSVSYREVEMLLSLYMAARDLGFMKDTELEDILYDYEDKDYNTLLYAIMRRIHESILEECDEEVYEFFEVEELEPVAYVNYVDSHFSIEPLNKLKHYDGSGINKEELIKEINEWFYKEHSDRILKKI